jgi:Rad3-related DNA helicase
MWTELAKTGLSKQGYFNRYEQERVVNGEVPPHMCWLCDAYAKLDCDGCPIAALEKRRKGCSELGIQYNDCRTTTARKAAARAYVTYLVELRECGGTNGT